MTGKYSAPNYKAVFFDFGGTLYDLSREHINLWKDLVLHYDETLWNESRFLYSIRSMRKVLDLDTANRFNSGVDPEMGRSYWINYNIKILEGIGFSNPDISKEMAEQLVKIYPELNNVFEIKKEILPILSQIKTKYKLGIISNTSMNLRDNLKSDQILDYFDILIFSNEIQRWKPDKEIFRNGIDSLFLEPEECIYVGDSLHCDALAAEKVGMTSILLDPDDEIKWSGIKIKSIAKITEYLDL